MFLQRTLDKSILIIGVIPPVFGLELLIVLLFAWFYMSSTCPDQLNCYALATLLFVIVFDFQHTSFSTFHLTPIHTHLVNCKM